MASESDLAPAIVSISTGTTTKAFTQTVQGYTTQSMVTNTADSRIMISSGIIVTQIYKSWGLENVAVAPTTQTFTISSVFNSSVTIPVSTSTLTETSVYSLQATGEKSTSSEQPTNPRPTGVTSAIPSTSRLQSNLAATSYTTNSTFLASSSYNPGSILAASPPSSTFSQPTETMLQTLSTPPSGQVSSPPSGILLGSILGGCAFICLFILAYYFLTASVRRKQKSSSPTITDDESRFPEIDDEKGRAIEKSIQKGKMRNEKY